MVYMDAEKIISTSLLFVDVMNKKFGPRFMDKFNRKEKPIAFQFIFSSSH